MKIKWAKLFSFLCTILLSCCSSERKLFERKTSDGKLIARSGYFSGIDYLTVEKTQQGGEIDFKLLYDCECGYNKMRLTKYDRNNNSWHAVTDTLTNPMFFDEIVQKEILVYPISFEQITDEQKKLLRDAIEKSNVKCCSNSNKSIDRIIGFVKAVPIKKRPN